MTGPGASGGRAVPLIVCADDYGLTDATSRSILAAHHGGVVTATSVLTLAPGALDRIAWLDEAPSLGVGVHLALVGEDPPLLAAAEVPSLVDRRGRLAPSWRHLVPRLAAGRIDPADVRRELQTQIAAVRTRRPVDHLDTHQHLHLWPSIAEVVVDLAREEAISRIRVPRPTSSGPRSRMITSMADRLQRRVADAGRVATRQFAGLDEAGGWTEPALIAAITRLASTGTSAEINVHPGPPHDVDRDRYPWRYGWGEELAALTGTGVAQAVEAHGFERCARLEP